jgi:hypothetical protein
VRGRYRTRACRHTRPAPRVGRGSRGSALPQRAHEVADTGKRAERLTGSLLAFGLLREPDLAIDVARYPVEDFVVERVLELITHRLLRIVAVRIVSSFYAHFGALTSIADVRWWLRDQLEILEQLYAVVAVTAILTIALNLALRALGLTVPDWAGPATGFVVAVPVSAIGYWSSRDRHRQQLRDAVRPGSAS